MIIFVILVLVCVSSALIAEKKESVTALIVFLLSLAVGIVSLVGLITANLPVAELQAKTEVEETYNTLNYILKSDKNNYIVLSKEISEYNTSVKQGRELLNNFWFKDYQYKFWNDMPLINLEDYE